MAINESWSPARLRAVHAITDDIRLFELVPEDGMLPYQVGGHLEVQVRPAGRLESRAFSLIGDGGPGDAYRIAVKKRSDGHGGSSYLWSLEPGSQLNISAPRNLFPLTYGASEYLLVAGGIGITPLYGMALALARRGARVRLLYAVKREEQLAFTDELRDVLGDRLKTFISERGQRIDPLENIRDLAADAEVYLCGPLSLREAFCAAWETAGRERDKLRFETFASGGHHNAEPFEVEVVNHNRRLTVQANQSMLQALIDNGIDDIIYDCEHGECGLCSVRVVNCDGVIDHRDVFYSDEQRSTLQDRRICTCVSRVVGGSISIDTSRQLVDTGPV